MTFSCTYQYIAIESIHNDIVLEIFPGSKIQLRQTLYDMDIEK